MTGAVTALTADNSKPAQALTTLEELFYTYLNSYPCCLSPYSTFTVSTTAVS